MDGANLPLFSTAALAILDRMPLDSSARGSFEIMSGGLMWPDEFPRPGSTDWAVVSPNWVYRYLLGCRASLTLGEERAELRPVWEQVTLYAPKWPGLRPERRGEQACRRLRAALRRQEKCLREFESHLGQGGSDAS